MAIAIDKPSRWISAWGTALGDMLNECSRDSRECSREKRKGEGEVALIVRLVGGKVRVCM